MRLPTTNDHDMKKATFDVSAPVGRPHFERLMSPLLKVKLRQPGTLNSSGTALCCEFGYPGDYIILTESQGFAMQLETRDGNIAANLSTATSQRIHTRFAHFQEARNVLNGPNLVVRFAHNPLLYGVRGLAGRSLALAS
jgi:hypothetical protein